MKILKNKVTIVFLIFLFFVGVISVSFLYSNKTFQEKFKEKNPNIESLAIFVDGEEVFDIPKKGSGYTLSSESNCNNGVTVSWDDTSWSAKVNYTNFQNNNERTKCNLYFEKMTFAKSIIQCANNGGSTPECMKDASNLESSLVYDETTDNNLRYTGANPNNYVSFNNELWRIIGIMENIDDGSGNKESRIKLIRNESIGDYSWDTSASDVNGGWGVNEWSQADAMKLMNPGFETESVGGSLYWNRKSGTCYDGMSNASSSCDFSSTGLLNESKDLIGMTVWNTGANDGVEYVYYILTNKFYEFERSTNNGKICTSETYCDDKLARSVTWSGYVGLMYPSDYGYATSGGGAVTRNQCLEKELYYWDSLMELSACRYNDWFFVGKGSHRQWTISPNSRSSQACNVFQRSNDGMLSSTSALGKGSLFPVLFLKSSVKITDGEGSSANPFILELQE